MGQHLSQYLSPKQTNDVMLGLGMHKHTLIRLVPQERFSMTVADVAGDAGTCRHGAAVLEYAQATWLDWSAHHG